MHNFNNVRAASELLASGRRTSQEVIDTHSALANMYSRGAGDSHEQIQNVRQQLARQTEALTRQASQLTETLQQLTNATEEKLAKRERELEKLEQRNRQDQTRIEWERQYFEEEKQKYEVTRERCLQIAFAQELAIVYLEVGGQHFETTPATLLSHPDCTLAYTFSKVAEYNPHSRVVRIDRNPKHFAEYTPHKYVLRIDRNPKHFEKILDFMRHDEGSLLWMQDPSLSSVQLREIEAEAVYYKLPGLIRVIRWELVAKKARVANLRDCGFQQVEQTGKKEKVLAYETSKEARLREPLNFIDFPFQNVTFSHPFSFRGCVLRGAVFKNCSFKAEIDLGETDIQGIRFESCSGLSEPTKTFLTINTKGVECIPSRW